MSPLERIAAALERIAATLEAKSAKPSRPPKAAPLLPFVEWPAPLDVVADCLKAIARNHPGESLTMDDLLAQLGIENATKGQRTTIGQLAGQCGFKQHRTKHARYYIAT